MKIPFGTQSYKSQSLPVSAQRALNVYAEREPEDAKTPVAMLMPPGITTFATVGIGPIRGLWQLNGLLYAVSGSELYSIDETGTGTLLGTGIVSGGSNAVSMTDNGTQLIIVNGQDGFTYSVGSGFAKITDVNFHSANTVIYFDGYFILDWAGTRKFFFSNLLDGTTYSSLDFITAMVQTGRVLTTANLKENLLVFCETCIETWYNSGDVNTPFRRYNGATIERGLGAPKAVVKDDNTVFFLGNDIIFYRIDEVLPTRVSTHAIEHEWQNYSTIDDAYCFSYTRGGHKFITVVFPTENKTWVYDPSTQVWHERESFSSSYVGQGRWRGNCHNLCYAKNMIGDANSGHIGYLDETVMTEFGDPVVSEITSPPIHKDRKRLFMLNLELDIETGVGLSTGQGSDPQMMLSWSDDGGRTFSSYQPWQSMGAQGAYRQRLRWTRLGQFRQRVLKVRISDPVRRSIISAHADIEIGQS